MEKSIRDISRRRFLEKAGVLAGGLGLAGLSMLVPGCGPGREKPPNILLLVADDAGWHDVGYHGSEIKTPHIDALAKTGLELDQFYVYPTCSPSRASLLTGRYASRFGIAGPIDMRSRQTLPKDVITLPEMLRRRGYNTAITGKWHLGLRPESGPRQFGFDYSYGFLHGQIDQYTHKYKNGDLSWHRNGAFIEEEGHATDLITREAVAFIKEKRDKSRPFFLYVPFSVPHYPLQEEEKWLKPYTHIKNKSRRLFAASMSHMDDSVGRLIRTLEEEKLRENTLVVFLSDNGAQEKWAATFEYEGRHGPYDRLGDNRPLRDWKKSLYEGGIRVPALVNWPGKIKAGKVKGMLTVNDIFPTIAALANAPLKAEWQLDGENIWPVLAGKMDPGPRTLYLRTDRQAVLRKGDWKLIHTGKTLEEGTDELYNLADDPEEKINLAAEKADMVDSLRRELAAEMARDSQ